MKLSLQDRMDDSEFCAELQKKAQEELDSIILHGTQACINCKWSEKTSYNSEHYVTCGWYKHHAMPVIYSRMFDFKRLVNPRDGNECPVYEYEAGGEFKMIRKGTNSLKS